ncbi:triosephosphate isomerase [Perkinsela sp. CCAP 1560/4]|nr:triosephosphate isomerase [Perkinsela sp. CCAP 1560/4]|eukprot:KNH06333.1 triosephosphate isomerase [Perkinsela sp. CCAP 1560/4]
MSSDKPTPVVVANWKCNGVKRSIYTLISQWNKAAFTHDVECYIACPSLYIPFLQSVLKHREFQVAAQNCVPSPGAFTGEICVDQLIDSHVSTVIIGHSERRKYFAESEKVIGEKCHACVTAGVRIVVCIGEGLCERQKGLTKEVVESQLQTIIRSVPQRYWSRVVIAYEPIWAIGTGKVASPTDAQDIHRFIRGLIASALSPEVGRSVRILYGGSVTSKSAEAMYQMPDVNGFLVGGASLTPDFLDIIRATRH